MFCGHCGSSITGERKIKKFKTGDRVYDYYRCSVTGLIVSNSNSKLLIAIAMKRQTSLLKCLNYTLYEVTLYYTIRKPFDVLVEGLVSFKNRGDRIRTCDVLVPNQVL